MTAHFILRDFVQVDGRRVHYRHAGNGPPVLLLHQSPRSSAEMETLMRALAAEFRVLAPDTPGFGFSEPVAPSDAEPGIDVFVDALAGFLDAVGIVRAALFGSHTGAIIATRFAARYPDRVCALVANGVLLTGPDERAEMLDFYFPRISPAWDGSHLAWLWSRLRDQLVFYPWFRRLAGNRIEWMMSLDELDAGAVDLLDAGDNYRGAYRAVLDYDIAPDLRRLQPPSCLMVARTDALSHFVPHYPPASKSLRIEVVDDFPDIPGAVAAFLRAHAVETPAGPAARPGRCYGLVSQMVRAGGANVHARRGAGGGGRTLVFLHDLGSSAASLDAVLGGLAGRRPLCAPDLPGHGLSDAGATTPEDMAAVLLAAVSAWNIDDFDLVAEGAAAAIALAMSGLAPTRLRTVVICNPIAVEGRNVDLARALQPPDLHADASGSHLFKAWSYLKDRDLYTPWHDRTPLTATPEVQPKHPAVLQQALIDLLRSRRCLSRQFEAALCTVGWEELAGSRAKVAATSGSAALARLPGAIRLPFERVNWNWPILDLLEE